MRSPPLSTGPEYICKLPVYDKPHIGAYSPALENSPLVGIVGEICFDYRALIFNAASQIDG